MKNKYNMFRASEFHGYEIRTLISEHEIWKSIDRRVFEIVAEKLAEDLYNKHKDQILDNMSLKSLIKTSYKKASKIFEERILKSIL